MAKKCNKVAKFAPIVAAVLGVVAVVMIFVAAVVFPMDYLDDVTFTGLQVTFGYAETTDVFGSTVTTEVLKFSFMNLLPYLMVIGAIVLSVLAFLGKGNKFFAIIAAVLFIVAGVLFFLTVAFTIDANGEGLGEGYVLGAGPIVAGICSILAGLVAAAPTVMGKVCK